MWDIYPKSASLLQPKELTMIHAKCGCENGKCQVCRGEGCKHPAGKTKVMYVGLVCDACATYIDPKYLLSSDNPELSEYRYSSMEECGIAGEHTTSCDDDGFCNLCGHQ